MYIMYQKEDNLWLHKYARKVRAPNPIVTIYVHMYMYKPKHYREILLVPQESPFPMMTSGFLADFSSDRADEMALSSARVTGGSGHR